MLYGVYMYHIPREKSDRSILSVVFSQEAFFPRANRQRQQRKLLCNCRKIRESDRCVLSILAESNSIDIKQICEFYSRVFFPLSAVNCVFTKARDVDESRERPRQDVGTSQERSRNIPKTFLGNLCCLGSNVGAESVRNSSMERYNASVSRTTLEQCARERVIK